MKIIFSLAFIFAVAVLLAFHAQARPLDGGFESVLDATYIIEKQEVRLIGGWAEVRAAPGSAGKIITAVFGEPVYGDLDSDGCNDAALFLAHDSGGSGTFYYVAAAIAKSGIYRGTNAVLLGDRVVLRTIRIRDNVIVAEYADRRPDESMAATPSIEKTMYLKLKDGCLEAVKAPR